MVAPSEDPDRPRGILSPADRKYLLASDEEREADYSRSARAQRKSAIHDRTTHALMDFVLLFDHLDDEELLRLFGPENYSVDEWSGAEGYPERTTPEGDERRDRTPNPPPEGLEDEFADRPELSDVDPETGQIQLKPPEERLIGIYEGMIDVLALFFKSFYERGNAEYPQVQVEQLIEASLRRVLADRGESLYDFRFEYSTSPLDIEQLTQRFYDGEKLTYDEFETLRREGNIVDSEGRPIDPADTASVRFGLTDFMDETDETDETDESD
jgi:hypothetical protein